jgi:nuclear transport factor 2 (NTF2) superfamily protein
VDLRRRSHRGPAHVRVIDESSTCFRAYGNENWEFEPDGLMRPPLASIDEHSILQVDRRIY